MFKLFNKSTDVVATKEVIKEIHETFYTEVDRLLETANHKNSLDSDKRELVEKAEKLKALGFTRTKEVSDAQEEIFRLEKLRKENEGKEDLINAINYFSQRYPNYKFITEKSVERICEKYGLVYGTVSKYTGTVPDKNLKHIEDFKIAEEDECYIEIKHFTFGLGAPTLRAISYEEYKEALEKWEERRSCGSNIRVIHDKSTLEIAAPRRDFDMTNAEVKNYKVSDIPDPIVLKPVIFNGQKHYLVVTAWGLEGSDDTIVNEKHN